MPKPDGWPEKLPYLDEQIQHCGVTTLCEYSHARGLRDLDKILVVHASSEPVAVLVPYKWFVEIQRVLEEFRKADEQSNS